MNKSRERFYGWVSPLSDYPIEAMLPSWEAAERQFWPPRPAKLPEGWRVKGEAPVLVGKGKRLPLRHWSCGWARREVSENWADHPVFVWELEEVTP